MGLSRRFLNLIVDNRIQGAKSLCSIDLRRHKLFNTTTPAPKGNALALNKIRLPSPSLSMRTSDSDLKDQRVHFFPAAADQRAFCLDQLGRGFLLEADTPRMVMMPCLHRPKLEPISLYIPCAGPDFDDLDGGGGGNLFIMDRRVAKPEPGGVSDGGGGFQFEALVYRKPSFGGFLSKTWHCDLLPPLPPHVGGSGHSCLEISSYGVVGSQVCISVDGDGTYCLAAVSNTYCWSEVGKWTLPFQGEVHYAPELKLWFGFTAEDQNLAAADLSAMDSRSQPHLLNSWKELEPPKGWQQVQDPQLVSLGSGMFCIGRFFRTDMDDCQNVTVLTGVEVVRGVNVLPGTADLRMVKHKSLCHKSGCSEDTITAVF
ncbi:unnamed protein product [Miscanthus lutarioriparius]|uniref:Uncharacterized protein n=1 Tax=Miscanthus lutarioriparius TaxID=422564 RepID=A0A811RSB7_9POAL|nr:unnamed protein product [Miscanthus lutarioriparius]